MGDKKYLYTIFAAMALMLTAFIGVGSASATVLCNEVGTTECTSYEKGSFFDASLTETAKLSTTGGTVLDECTSGMIRGTTSNTGGSTETVNVSISELKWESCTSTTDTISNGELEIHSISGTDNGTVTGKSNSITVNTAFGSCTYGTGTGVDLGTLEAGNPAALKINATLAKTAGGFTCPSEAKLVANYSVTSPRPLYVSQKAGGAAINIKIENIGLLPDKNTKYCTFANEGEICKIEVTNNSTVNVNVKNEIFTGIEGTKRFQVIASCKGKIAANGGVCIAEVKAIKAVAEGWRNSYYLEVEQEGKASNWTVAYVFLQT